MSIRIRLALAQDYAAIEHIENTADALLVDLLTPATWAPAAPGNDRAAQPGFTLLAEDVATDLPVGFAHVLEVEGFAHLEQLSVLPEHGRRGYGRQLVEAAAAEARARGHRQLTLRTFADVAWNAPFYARCGFVESEPQSEFHRALVGHEAALVPLGRRIQMTLAL